MTKEELQSKKCSELREIAREYEIAGRWDMRKDQLIEAILRFLRFAGNCECEESEDSDENKRENASVDMSQKIPYIEQAPIGSLVAFRLPNGRVKSAKIVKRSLKGRKLKLETNYGAEYIVSFDEILWVRTGKRWPRGVYNLLKGVVTIDGENV